MITVVKKKRKKYIGSARFDPRTATSYLKTLPQGRSKATNDLMKNFILYKTDVIIAVNPK